MSTPDQLIGAIRDKLFTAVIGDVMDAMGLKHQFLPPYLRPVREGAILVGPAMTVREEDNVSDGESGDFGRMFEALDDLKAGEIYVCAGSTGAFALWGELMSTRAQACGAVGAVVDGYHRDTRGIRRLGFPVYSAGSYGQDQRPRGTVTDFRCRIRLTNGAEVNSGDIVVADLDGVLAIPSGALDAVVAAALEKVGIETEVQRAIKAGGSTVDIFAKTGVM